MSKENKWREVCLLHACTPQLQLQNISAASAPSTDRRTDRFLFRYVHIRSTTSSTYVRIYSMAYHGIFAITPRSTCAFVCVCVPTKYYDPIGEQYLYDAFPKDYLQRLQLFTLPPTSVIMIAMMRRSF